jgi:Family of unknown function (DUF5683)
MRKTILLALAILPMIYLPSMAINLESGRLAAQISSIQNSGLNYASSYTGDEQKETPSVGGDKNIYKYEYKSPKKAFLYSLIIPGWGQKYAGSKIIKPIVFLAADIGLWSFHFKYHSDGSKKTDEFQAFADTYWREGTDTTNETYRYWLQAHSMIEDSLTHQLPDSKTQQYYEMIGKYDQFRSGWVDYWSDTLLYDSTVSPLRDRYNTMRGKANDVLNKAKTFIVISMVNHLLSAIDAAVAANRHNRNQSGDNWLSVRTEMKYYSATEQMPIVRLACRF